MPTFQRPAVEISQGALKLYLTFVTPRDLFNSDFYRVETLDPQQSAGYQRILEPRRSRRLARHLYEAHDSGYANLPTSVLLATDASVRYDERSRTLTFDTDKVCPFNVVDGQHRIEGLREAYRRDQSLSNFQLPATLAVGLDSTHQMYHFYIVNTTQKPVDRDLNQQITARFSRMQGVEDLPYLPHWYRNQVDSGIDDKALRIVESLNSHPDSPLCGRIKMANDERPRGRRIAQASVVSALKAHVLAGINPISSESELDRITAVVVNYLRACELAFVPTTERDDTVAWTTSGMWFFLLISKWVFAAIYASTRVFTVQALTQVINATLQELDDEYSSIAQESWWRRRTGGAKSLNRASANALGNGFLEALNRSRQSEIRV